MTPTENSRKTLTVEEAARELGISRYLAYESIKRTGSLGDVPVIRVGNRIVISRHALDRVLEADARQDMASTGV